MNTDKKVSRVAPAWHAKVIAEIEREFAETNELTETARRRRARLGMMLIWVKAAGKADGSIPHGQFGSWLEKNLPGIPRRTAGDYLTEANSICDLLRWQNGEIRHFELPPHKLLLAKSDDLKGVDRDRQKKLLNVIEQQSHFRAVTKYQQVELVDDATVPKIGRHKNSAGRPPAQTGSIEEILERNRQVAMAAGRKISKGLKELGWYFLALDFNHREALFLELERTYKCLHAARRQTKPDHQEIFDLWKSL